MHVLYNYELCMTYDCTYKTRLLKISIKVLRDLGMSKKSIETSDDISVATLTHQRTRRPFENQKF